MSMSMERLEEALAQEEATNVQLRARIAELEAQQEPVAWMQDSIELYVQDRPSAIYTIPLYTSPPVQQNIRNATLDEIATKIEAMPFGDTAASFAVWIREQKTKTCPPCHGDCNQGRACPARGGHA